MNDTAHRLLTEANNQMLPALEAMKQAAYSDKRCESLYKAMDKLKTRMYEAWFKSVKERQKRK